MGAPSSAASVSPARLLATESQTSESPCWELWGQPRSLCSDRPSQGSRAAQGATPHLEGELAKGKGVSILRAASLRSGKAPWGLDLPRGGRAGPRAPAEGGPMAVARPVPTTCTTTPPPEGAHRPKRDPPAPAQGHLYLAVLSCRNRQVNACKHCFPLLKAPAGSPTFTPLLRSLTTHAHPEAQVSIRDAVLPIMWLKKKS